ncbi:MAG: energy-coupling factor ABC transporter ATP-binding protein [Treponema sp.]|nr:energy-coupling factor ABC transporter ATP-binding protein [Treponema sp.]
MDKPRIVVDKLSHTYPDGWRVLSNLSFSIQAGTTIALAGANGSGKTTLLWLIAGILEASQGSIHIDEIPLNRGTVRQIQRKIGLAFQNPEDQLFMATVRQDVEFGPRNLYYSDQEIETRATDAMKKTGCLHLAERPPYRLSGGEKRLASLATILATDAEILLLDEPTNALDPRSRRNTINLLRRLPQTKLIATHDLDLALELCDEVILLHQGTLAARGPARQILSDPLLLESVGLELPLSLQG